MDYRALAKDIILMAKKRGVKNSEVLIIKEETKEVSIREGKVDLLSENISINSRIKLIKEGKSALISLNNFDKNKLTRAIENSLVYMEKQKPDKAILLPPENALGSVSGELFIEDKEEPSIEEIKRKLVKMEKASINFDKKVKYSDGAFYNFSKRKIYLANSRGFYGSFSKTEHSFYISVVAEDRGERRSGAFWSENPFYRALESEDLLGKIAAEKAIKKLHPKKPKTGEYPVVFDNITASSLVEVLSELLSGDNVYRKNTIFAEMQGKIVANSVVTIIDNPLVKKLSGSRPFDGEGVFSREKVIIDRGKLENFLTNTYYAKKINHSLTSNASFSVNTLNGIVPTNFFIKAGEVDESELIKSIKKGIYITGLFSTDSINPVTGDFSWGAEGFLIEKGERTYPISEFTIAGNILDLLKNITEICDNIDFNRGEIASPSFLVRKGITIGGK